MSKTTRMKYLIRPLEQLYSLERVSAHMNPQAAGWPSMNVVIDQNSVKKRGGLSVDRTLATGETIYTIQSYAKRDGTKHNVILTGEDLLLRMTGTDETYKYITPTHTTGTVASLNPAKTVVTGTDTNWSGGGVAAGDKFIIDADHDENKEPDSNWAEVKTVDSNTQITLTAAYTGTATSGAYKIRKVYSLPTDERWVWAVAGDKFVFSNGNENTQYFDGTTVGDLDSEAVKARYLVNYANRLFMADVYISGTREPWTVMWSKENDPTDFADDTAGSADFVGTEEPIVGLGVVGNAIFVYKKSSITIGNRTGQATNPVAFPYERKGVGLHAPYSLVHAMGTNFFLGTTNFYMINGDMPEAIGDPIRDKFFGIVPESERNKVWGAWVPRRNCVAWMALTNTAEGRLGFAYDYIHHTWMTYRFGPTITAIGEIG